MMLTLLNVLITFLIPIYKSYKCLNVGNAERQAYWLMYWVIIGCVSCVEGVLRWAPFYNYIKIAFVIYLEMQGSEVIYNRLVKEVLQRHETEIEVGLRRLKGGVYDMGVKYIKLVYNSFSQQQQQQDEFIPLESEQEQSSNISQLINSYAPTIISDQLSNQLKRRGAKSNDQQQQQQQPKQQNAQPTKPKQSTQPDQNASSWLFGYL